MPKVIKLGPKFFAQIIKYPVKWSFKYAVQIGDTREIEEPYRTGKSLVISFPFKKAFVFGIWTGKLDEMEALTHALMGRTLTLEELRDVQQKESTIEN